MRCISLARSLRDEYSVGIRFAMLDTSRGVSHTGRAIVESYQFPVDIIPRHSDEEEWLDNTLKERLISGLIFDIRTSLSASALMSWRSRNIIIVCIDDPAERRLACDLAFYPPVQQIKEMSWAGFSGELKSGWQWILLGPSFTDLAQKKKNEKPHILISMGGSDPAGITLKVVSSLCLFEQEYEAHVVLGPAYQHYDQLEELIQINKLNINLHQNVRDMASFMASMDLAIASFGVTAYELAACGIPSLLLCLTEDHSRSAESLHNSGAALCLGLHHEVDIEELAKETEELLINTQKRLSMQRAAISLNIGSGSKRIAATIKQTIARNANEVS